MSRRNWKHVHARSLPHAIVLCTEYARAKKNFSIDRIADHLGTSASTIYKWMSNGKIPAQYIRGFEATCGCNFITRYLAATDNKLLIDIPRGKSASNDDLLALQTTFNDAFSLLTRFYKSEADTDETIAALTDVMSSLAGHRVNVTKSVTPELALFYEDD